MNRVLARDRSGKFSDYRNQFVTNEEFLKAAPEYCRQAGLPTKSQEFVDHLRNWLGEKAQQVDSSFPENEYLSIENGEPVLQKLTRRSRPENPLLASQLLLPSTILRRLGSHNRQNRLNRAFHELGRVIRTEFLLNWISDLELRQVTLGAMNKSEQFNRFSKWIAFGGQVLEENDRDEQRKLIKYNHLVANCLIFYNVCGMTQRLHKMRKEGVLVDAKTLSRLNPYLTHHINRYGEYRIDLNRQSSPIDYQLPILTY